MSETQALRRAERHGKIKRVTVDNYETRLAALAADADMSLAKLLRRPALTLRLVDRRSAGADQTARSYLTAILALLRYDEELQASLGTSVALAFKRAFRDVDRRVRARYDANEPTERQRRAYMPLAEVLRRRDALDADAPEYLVLCLYTMIPPLRADFGNVRILTREPRGEDASARGNYLVVRDKYMRLVLNEFKSKSKKLPQYNKILPRDLERVVRNSLARQPRSHLLVSPRTGEPFVRDNTYVVYVHRLLERALGKKVSISMLRHIFVNAVDYNAITAGERTRLSADMLHSVATNDRYRLVFRDSAKSR